MRQDYIKTGVIVCLLLLLLVAAFLLQRALRRLSVNAGLLQSANEANAALQSEVTRMAAPQAEEGADNIQYPSLPTPTLGGSLHYKMQVIHASDHQFEAWLTGKSYRIRLSWDQSEQRWLLYRESTDEAASSGTGTHHQVACSFDDSATLQRTILQLLTATTPDA